MKDPEKIKDLLLKHNVRELVFVDVGAKGKLECTGDLDVLTEMHAFEPNPEAFSELEKIYEKAKFKKLYLNQTALADTKDISTLFVARHASMSSLLEPDMDNYQRHFGEYKEYDTWQKRMDIHKKISVKTNTLDSYFENLEGNIDFLKIDTQGTELIILKGAKKLLEEKKISIIKLEVTTIPVYKNQVLFSEIDIFLRSLNYALVDFITYPEEYSPAFQEKIIPRHSGPCGDAIYMLENENENTTWSLKKCVVLSWLGYVGLAMKLADILNLDSKETIILFNASQPPVKQKIKSLLKNIFPPFLWHFIKNRANK